MSVTEATDIKVISRAPGLRLSIAQVALIGAIGLAIAVGEYIFAYQDVGYGIIMALFTVLIIYAAISVWLLDPKILACAESLSLVPLYILFTSALPWFFIGQDYLMPAVYSCILGLCLWHVYRHNLDLKQMFNFKREKLLKYLIIGVLIGLPTGLVEYYILYPARASPSFEIKYLLRDTVYMLFFVGLAENVLFLGFIQIDLQAAYGWKWGLFGATAIFAIMHLTWRSVPELGFVFVAGFVLGILYLKTKDMTASIMAHAANNTVLVGILPYFFAKWFSK